MSHTPDIAENLPYFIDAERRGNARIITDLKSIRDELLAMLKRLEWSGWALADADENCPVCRSCYATHNPGCELSALLTKAEGK
jgi:hypothetical protein